MFVENPILIICFYCWGYCERKLKVRSQLIVKMTLFHANNKLNHKPRFFNNKVLKLILQNRDWHQWTEAYVHVDPIVFFGPQKLRKDQCSEPKSQSQFQGCGLTSKFGRLWTKILWQSLLQSMRVPSILLSKGFLARAKLMFTHRLSVISKSGKLMYISLLQVYLSLIFIFSVANWSMFCFFW